MVHAPGSNDSYRQGLSPRSVDRRAVIRDTLVLQALWLTTIRPPASRTRTGVRPRAKGRSHWMLPLYLEGLGDPLEFVGRQVVKRRVGRKSGRGGRAAASTTIQSSAAIITHHASQSIAGRPPRGSFLPPKRHNGPPGSPARYRRSERSGILTVCVSSVAVCTLPFSRGTCARRSAVAIRRATNEMTTDERRIEDGVSDRESHQ